jgi:hypothetical protein
VKTRSVLAEPLDYRSVGCFELQSGELHLIA